MIGLKTQLEVADNSGAKRVWCIGVLGRANKKLAGIGDIITGHVRESGPDAQAKKGELVRCVIVRTRTPIRRADGTTLKFDSNAVVLIDNQNNPKGTRVFGPVARELREGDRIYCMACMTRLRVVRRRAKLPEAPLNVIGMDDWAWRRNHRYGSIVCDLERRRIVALLPDREIATVRAWLAGHPQIAVVSRDRGGGYGEAVTKALHDAVQVADRWHLMENASSASLVAVRKSIETG